MASCDELFQKKLELDLQRQENDAELARIRDIRASRSEIPSDDEFEGAFDDTMRNLQDPELQDEAARRAQQAQQRKDDIAAGVEPKDQTSRQRVNIGAGQPTNFDQAIREAPEAVIRDFGLYSSAIRRAAETNLGESWLQGNFKSPRERAMMLQELSGTGNASGWIRTLADGIPRIRQLVDDSVKTRFMYETSRAVYRDSANKILEFMRQNPGAAIPDDMKLKAFRQFKVTLMTQRSYDQIRTGWSVIGKNLQDRGFEGPLRFGGVEGSGIELGDDLGTAIAEAEELVGGSAATDAVKEAAAMTVDQIQPEQSFGKVLEAIDKAQTNPDDALVQLEIEVDDIRARGVEPRKALTPQQIKYNRLKKQNTFIKDWQLFNNRTQSLNAVSNFTMLFFGPYRGFYEDIPLFTNKQYRNTYGTTRMRGVMEAWQVNFGPAKYAFFATRDAGKELWVDAFQDGKALFSTNPETYAARYVSEQDLYQELKDMKKAAALGAAPLNPEVRRLGNRGKNKFRQALSTFNPERHSRYIHSGVRLWLYHKTKNPTFLKIKRSLGPVGNAMPSTTAAMLPGLRGLQGFDNLTGFFQTVYRVRHDIEVRARNEGLQFKLENELGKDNTQGVQDALDQWKESEFQKMFYDIQPDEAQRLAWRKETGLGPELVGDQQVDDLIMETRVGDTYGGPISSPEMRKAMQYSDEMRFANLPGEEGSFQRRAYNKVRSLQQEPEIENFFQYLPAIWNGAGFDIAMTGLSPAWRKMTADLDDAAKRRVDANLVMAGHLWGMFALASATGQIIGSGPVDPKEQREWRMKLKAQGKKPNSIFGLQLIGGYPIFNTLFLGQDLIDNLKWSVHSAFDGFGYMEAMVGVMAGYLQRNSSIGQVRQLMEIFYSDDSSSTDKVQQFAGYYTGSRNLPIGPVRTGERVSRSSQFDLYTDPNWTEEDFQDLDPNILETWERRLRKAAYSVTGLTGVAGGKYKDNDWIGTEIRFPWGMGVMDYLKERFDPVLWPDRADAEKKRLALYEELDDLDLLTRPAPLVNKRLDDVPLSDDMQKIYNDTMGTIKGGNAILVGGPASFRVQSPVKIDVTKPGAFRVKQQSNLFDIDMRLVLQRHAKGKTFKEAAISLMESPTYKQLQRASLTTTNIDRPADEIQRRPAYILMKALKQHYMEMTRSELINMEKPPGAVEDWRKKSELKSTAERMRILEGVGALEQFGEAMSGQKVLTDPPGGPQ